ncbi:hypothetical protein F5X98DRAFT_363238 [Xylaria grammica]|nr:hypothetical protein F5X98DRAFT_363238 [Xylaria grammica]
MAHMSSSEDEFPDIEVVIQKRQQKTTGKESVSRQPSSPKSAQTSFNDSIGKTPATARRRRKLGQGQPVDRSLLKPWQSFDVGKETNSRTPSSRQPSLTRTEREETAAASAEELTDHLPAKSKRAASRVVSSRTVFDSPPKEQTRSRRLISRGAKKALDPKLSEKRRNSIAFSDVSEFDAEVRGKHDILRLSADEESDFILRGDSDSDDLSIPSPHRSQSPSGPRRMQRRVLSSTRKPTWMKPVQDEPTTSPKKRPEKQKTLKEPTTRKPKVAPKEDLEDVFEKLKISFDDSEPEEPATRTAKPPMLDPPVTPRKNANTASPAKAPRIPMSPWKPEQKEFWDPEVNFAWIDQHSPPKRSTKKALLPDPDAPEHKEELKRRYGTSPEKKQAKKAFDAVKEDLARAFLRELDDVVTGGQLERLTEATGGLRVVWSNTLQTTAGRAHWKCKTTTTASKQPSALSSSSSAKTATATTAVQHYAFIELATKVLANESDLLNTVAHEFCHLAVFLLHGKPKLAHGAEFKAFGHSVMRAAAAAAGGGSSSSSSRSSKDKQLKTPRARGVEINVTTRHSYEIEYRFVWRCAGCGGEVHRHSRSVDPARHRCGRCKVGALVQVKPVPRGGGGGSKSASREGSGEPEGRDVARGEKRKKTAYQEFTSREMKALSLSHKGLSFKEKMVLVSARWGEHQRVVKAKAEMKTAGDDGGAGGGGGPAAPVSVKGLAAAVEVLEIGDDDGSS